METSVTALPGHDQELDVEAAVVGNDTQGDLRQTFRSLSNEIYAFLDQGKFSQAEAVLNSFAPRSSGEKRIHKQLSAHIAMGKCDYNAAIDALHFAMQNYGRNISLQADLMNSFYLSGDYLSWNRHLLSFEEELGSLRETLSPSQRLRMLTEMSTAWEEKAEPGKALREQTALLQETSQEKVSFDYCILQAQWLRLSSEYRRPHRLVRQFYSDLLSLKEQSPSLYGHIEVQLALFHAENFLFGIDMAVARFEMLVSHGFSWAEDERLFHFTLLEEYLYQQKVIPKPFLETCERLSANVELERILLAFSAVGFAPSLPEILNWSRKLSPAAYLRMINLAANRSEEKFARSLVQQAETILSTLHPSSRRLWRNRLPCFGRFGERKRVVIKFAKEDMRLSFGGMELSIASRKVFSRMIEALIANNGECDLERFVREVWQVTYNESFHTRVRVAVLRLNELLMPLCGQQKAILLRSNTVAWSRSVEFSE